MTSPLDELAQYAMRVVGRDATWKRHGSCRSVDESKKPWFTCLELDTVIVAGAKVTGHEAHKHAVDICFGCPVQWECARWAIEVEEECGVWSMPPRLLGWMQTKAVNPLGIIDTARVSEIPVQTAVAQARAEAV